MRKMGKDTGSNQRERLKHKIESLLFTIGRSISLERISKMLDEKNKEEIKRALKELQKEYASRGGSIVLENIGDQWLLTVKAEYLEPIMDKITQTEFSKALAETIAFIAWKAPVLQSEVVRVRSNKAYDHIKRLEELGFITKKKSGKSYEIELSKRFFEYFEINDDEELKKRIEKDIDKKNNID